jgi:hypothetical protein
MRIYEYDVHFWWQIDGREFHKGEYDMLNSFREHFYEQLEISTIFLLLKIFRNIGSIQKQQMIQKTETYVN